NFGGCAGPAEPPAVEGYDGETAALGPEEQARLAAVAIEAVAEREAYGFCTSGVTELAVASTTGVGVSQKMTDAVALVIAAGAGESGYAERSTWRVADLEPATVAREAVETCARTRDAVEIAPAPYRAVL